MNVNNLGKIVLLALFLLGWTGCQKEEWDILEEETPESTVFQGKVTTVDGRPLVGVVVRMDYQESAWLSYSKTRHKAEATTARDGSYRLRFQVKEDEREDTANVEISKLYSLSFDLGALSPETYILPADLRDAASSSVVYTLPTPEPASVHTHDMYIPRKRVLRVRLKDFAPQREDDYIRFANSFPYGMEDWGPDNLSHVHGRALTNKLDEPYELRGLSAERERVFEVPFSWNDTNVFWIERMKDGVYTVTEDSLFVTDDAPEELTFDY